VSSALRLATRFRPLRVVYRLWLQVSALLAGVRGSHPARLVVLGYGAYIMAGWGLLCLPLAQRGAEIPTLDNLFTATSAVSTTGLVTVSVADRYTLFGQAVIAALIQLGGIGYMTLGSFVILARRRELPSDRAQVGQVVFSLPESFRLDRFIVSVIKFTVAIEVLGAAALYAAFRHAGMESPMWSAVFHSVSAFCTAGFSLYNEGFESHASDFWINMVIACLSYLGAIGFIVCVDFARVLRGKASHMTLTSRIILHATLWLTVAGTAVFFVVEPSIRTLPPEERLLAAFFQCMAAMTTVGFNTVSIGALSKPALLLIVALMIVGASPSGTGGGLKVTTLSAVLGLMKSSLRGAGEVTFWGRPVPTHRVSLACASLGFYLSALAASVFLLTLTETASLDAILFEAASALGTVGLSMGLTPSLTLMGRIVIIAAMFCGRCGPLTLGVALFHGPRPAHARQDNDLAV